jgi:hypothetical protein
LKIEGEPAYNYLSAGFPEVRKLPEKVRELDIIDIVERFLYFVAGSLRCVIPV